MFGLAILLLATAASNAATIFPSDGEDPRRPENRALIEAACPGHVREGQKYLSCDAKCPDNAGLPEYGSGWWFVRVTRGHFLSPQSNDAVLDTSGCEPHSENFGGSILLTRRGNRWVQLWYKAGVETSQCHKAALAHGRDLLVCMGTYGGQGTVNTQLDVEDILAPEPNLMAGDGGFFQSSDTVETCGGYGGEGDPDPLTRAVIERVEFLADEKHADARILVTASFGRRHLTSDQATACIAAQRPGGFGALSFAPATKRYKMQFLFDGHNYKPSPDSRLAARIFAAQ
jgi:hypothetical protein